MRILTILSYTLFLGQLLAQPTVERPVILAESTIRPVTVGGAATASLLPAPGGANLIANPAAPLIAPAPAPRASHPKPLFWFSVASLVAADVADSVTSWSLRNTPDVRETNPLFGNQFDTRAVAVKSALLGAQLTMEWLLCRHHPERTAWFTWLNFATAGSYSWAAAKNYSLR